MNGLPESADGDWVIGSHKNEAGQFFIGLMDEVAFYDYRIDDPNGDDDPSDSVVAAHYNALFPDPGSPCDFDDDGDCDLDELQYVGLDGADSKYDVDGSGGTINSDDTVAWLDLNGTVPGDANLDSVVDAGDLNAVGLNWQSTVADSWAQGDFDGNRTVDAGDLNLVGLNWQFGAPVAADHAAAAVPEPSAGWLLAIGILVMFSKQGVRPCMRFCSVGSVGRAVHPNDRFPTIL